MKIPFKYVAIVSEDVYVLSDSPPQRCDDDFIWPTYKSNEWTGDWDNRSIMGRIENVESDVAISRVDIGRIVLYEDFSKKYLEAIAKPLPEPEIKLEEVKNAN